MTGLPLPGDTALVVQHIVIGEISPIISWLNICRFRHLRFVTRIDANQDIYKHTLD
jgi:hypothetical protein